MLLKAGLDKHCTVVRGQTQKHAGTGGVWFGCCRHMLRYESREILGTVDPLRYNCLNHAPATRTRRCSCMRIKLQLVLCSDEGHEETVTDVITLNKNSQRIEHLGLTMAEAKQLLSTLQQHLLQHQVDTFLDRCSICADCGALL